MKTFYEESCEWMKELNYDVSNYNSDKTYITFSPKDKETNKPLIICYIKNGEKKCCLTNCSNFKMFLELKTSDLQFKHPDIKKYISVMTHYSDLAELYPPF